MMSQPGSQKILIGILSNISRSKEMKFGQFLEYKKTDIFFKG